ncbi:MAG: isoprenylcysteine carboxylmethyltransferase family protein, partial [Candidatus Alcyoniella australis]|nr:isoprenylcysteine carboxylmethyltransferase family protein [Candidatus Alcyoniella australis]
GRETMECIAFPIAVSVYLVIALVLPTIRVWRNHGVCPLVIHRESGVVARTIGVLFGLLLLGLFFWSILYWRIDPQTLGVLSTPRWVSAVGWMLLVLGTAITLLAQRHMGEAWRVGVDDRPTALVQRGLFSLSRNPIFAGMIVTLCGMAAITPSAWTIAVMVLVFALISVQVRIEERHLVALHGEAYLRYAGRVGRFMPGLGLLRSSPFIQ